MNSASFRITIIAISLLVSFQGYTQNTNEIAGAEYGALSGAGAAGQSVWQNLLNPSGILNSSTDWQAGASYINRFSLNELSSRDLVGSIPVGNGKVGFVVHSFGYSAFLQNQFSAAYALNLSPNFRGSVQLNYLSVNVGEGFGRYNALTANVGFQYDFTEKISAGLVIKNPNRAALSTEIQEYVQTLIQGGIKFQLADNLVSYVDITKDIDFSPWLSLGLNYTPLDNWHLRGGIATNSNSLSFGVGYQPEKWSIDIASLYHQTLGFSPMISFTYRNE